jgi:hypothetical protein
MKGLKEYINESYNPNPENWPKVEELGDGEYKGALWGHCFLYEGKKYYSDLGVKNIYPIYFTAIVENNEVKFEKNDIYQRQELVKLFDDAK